ncbi:MAG: DUF2815 family protein [Bacteroides sp.]|nr:DUF2815 family protein [Bacteroides sp.]
MTKKIKNFTAGTPKGRPATSVVLRARLSYVHLDTPWAGAEGNTPKYSVSAIIPKEDVETVGAVRKAIDAALTEGVAKCWKGKRPNPKASSFKYPLKDGDEERPDDPAYAGAWFFGANSSSQPALVDRLKHPVGPEAFYSGCWGLISVNFFPFAQGSNGVSAGLNSVLKWADDDALGGNRDGAHDFDDFDTEPDEEELEDL